MYPELEKHKREKRLIFHSEVYFTLQHVRDRAYCIKDQILQATCKGTVGNNNSKYNSSKMPDMKL